jgi:hypothetical protein
VLDRDIEQPISVRRKRPDPVPEIARDSSAIKAGALGYFVARDV